MKKLILAALLSLSFGNALALEVVPYNEKAIIKDGNAGNPYAIHFYAEWCIICQQQKFMINELKKDDRFAKLTVYMADFDFEKSLKEKMKVERQSTLVMFKDGLEINRSLGKKEKDQIADLFKTGL